MDQYMHPHESTHTISEALEWFDILGLEFLKSIPKPIPFDPFQPKEKLFEKMERGSNFDHILVQLGMLLKGGREGGFFILAGRKK